MVSYNNNFKCVILSPNNLVYENEVNSLFLTGDSGEFEILAYHYPLIAVLRKSDIVINQEQKLPIAGGVVRFFANECTIIIEEDFGAFKKN